jgi:hypothetical protein
MGELHPADACPRPPGPPAGRRFRSCPLEAPGHASAAAAVLAAPMPQVGPVAWGRAG